jgi:hypothetical protein
VAEAKLEEVVVVVEKEEEVTVEDMEVEVKEKEMVGVMLEIYECSMGNNHSCMSLV